MDYYGDRRSRVRAAGAVEALARRVAERLDLRGFERRSALVAALVDAGMLAQALADAAFDARGEDAPDPASDLAMDLCAALAREVIASFDGTEARTGSDLELALRALRAARLPLEVEERTPEGYAHYAVYPECYLLAAREAPPAAEWSVIGIRSIGTGLAAIVAAALGARRVATVRPRGDPYARSLAVSPALRARIVGGAHTAYAVVDEGPGRSGSSFLSVVRELERAGVAADRVHLFPSHAGGPGPAAGDDARRSWSGLRRHLRTFDDVALGPGGTLPRWLARAIPAAGNVEDLSAGAWRRRVFSSPARWPPVFAQQERRKLLVTADRARWIAEFAGIGRFADARFRRAQVLADAGVGVPVVAMCHGFLARPWIEAAPLDAAARVSARQRAELVEDVAGYLALRARAFPASPGDGATPERLAAMMRTNTVEVLGPEVAEAAERVSSLATEIAGELRPIAVDGKLELWEWLRTASGRLLKADAFQHADSHELAGAQDVAWDVAGATVELGLERDATLELARRVELDVGVRIRPASLTFHEAAYSALRVARWSFALQSEPDVTERGRIERELARYRQALRDALRRA